MSDIQNTEFRTQVLSQINTQENKDRKIEAVKRFEVYKGRQRIFLEQMLKAEYELSTVQETRIISSINLAKRIVNSMASIYKKTPTRTFATESGKDLSENEQLQIENLYSLAKANIKLKKSNRWYKLYDQCALHVIPRNGIIDIKVLSPHHYDTIPDPMNPEEAKVYIINVFDKSEAFTSSGGLYDLNAPPTGVVRNQGSRHSDSINQKTGDPDDYKALMQRFIWWSKDYHFVTNGRGEIIEDDSPKDGVNPFGILPFIDIAGEKDLEYWIRNGSSDTDFSLDINLQVTDYVNIGKMQGFAQAIIASEEPPKHMDIGPNKVLHLPLDPEKEVQPTFQFANPGADLGAQKDIIETLISLYLSAKGEDPTMITGSGDVKKFNSGLERLLALIEQFEASQDDIDLFVDVEDKLLELFVVESNVMQEDPDKLNDKLKLARLPEDTFVTVKYAKPESIQTKKEVEDSNIKLMDSGLKSKSEAIADLREIGEDEAIKVMDKIDSEQFGNTPTSEDGIAEV